MAFGLEVLLTAASLFQYVLESDFIHYRWTYICVVLTRTGMGCESRSNMNQERHKSTLGSKKAGWKYHSFFIIN